MNSILFDSSLTDGERRLRLYAGQVFVMSPRPTALALTQHARGMIERAFGSVDPREAQHKMPVEDFVSIVAPLKPRFIHHPRTKDLIRALLRDVECDMERTYFDVPRLRVSAADGYLSAGVGYVLHPHRDTWYAAPMCQLNWWLPVYEFEPESGFTFYPRYWSEPVRNTSSSYDHYEWNRDGRRNAAQHVHRDTRRQPRPAQPVETASELRVVCPPGGIVLFSGAQLHATVPNTSGRTRFSIDFRTAHRDEIETMGGASNLDSEPRGTTLRELMRGSDLTPLPPDLVARYDREPPPPGDLLFHPPPEALESPDD